MKNNLNFKTFFSDSEQTSIREDSSLSESVYIAEDWIAQVNPAMTQQQVSHMINTFDRYYNPEDYEYLFEDDANYNIILDFLILAYNQDRPAAEEARLNYIAQLTYDDIHDVHGNPNPVDIENNIDPEKLAQFERLRDKKIKKKSKKKGAQKNKKIKKDRKDHDRDDKNGGYGTRKANIINDNVSVQIKSL